MIAISNTGLLPSMAGLSSDHSPIAFITSFNLPDPRTEVRSSSGLLWSCNPRLSFRIAWFRLFRVRSPLLSESRLFSLPLGTEMVHFPRFASPPYVFRWRYAVFPRRGFPHSDIPGSQTACVFPRLFVASHVLHRLQAPRHPHACS
jgi:hypothetical protein